MGFAEDFKGLGEIVRRPRFRRRGTLIARIARALAGFAVVQIVRAEYPDGLFAGPLTRGQLVARANAICSVAEAKFDGFRPSATAIAMSGSAADLESERLVAATDGETTQLRELRPSADVAAEWHLVMAGLVAHDRFVDSVGAVDVKTLAALGRALGIAAATGNAAERRLGISCSTFYAPAVSPIAAQKP